MNAKKVLANKNVKTLLEVTHVHVELVTLKTPKMRRNVQVKNDFITIMKIIILFNHYLVCFSYNKHLLHNFGVISFS